MRNSAAQDGLESRSRADRAALELSSDTLERQPPRAVRVCGEPSDYSALATEKPDHTKHLTGEPILEDRLELDIRPPRNV